MDSHVRLIIGDTLDLQVTIAAGPTLPLCGHFLR
jgi:hypothetical protein